jgi:hypothetical protein
LAAEVGKEEDPEILDMIGRFVYGRFVAEAVVERLRRRS